MNVYCKISSHPNEVYYVTPGVTFTLNANEELDSSSVVLKHIENSKRLTNIKPYDWICFYTDEACTQRLSIDTDDDNNSIPVPRLLINSFYEKETNIFEHIFEYTITCMSETKLLEKIQLPNRQWMTKSDGTKKTVAQVIDELMQLYIPKVKIRSEDKFIYDYIIRWDRDYLNTRFNVELKDVSVSSPTLRQALTSLMQQCSCIPVVKDGKLTWLDFLKAEKETFVRDSTTNYIERSLASDSYSNSLVCFGSNMLDSGNTTINEILHFSDRNNLLLKQTSNLFLETSKPIYYVNKLKICNWFKTPIVFSNSKNPNGHSGSYFDVWAHIQQENDSIILEVDAEGYDVVNNELKIKILEYSGNFEEKTAVFLNEINETRTYNPYQSIYFDKMGETTDVVVYVTATLKNGDDIYENVTICDITKETPDEYRPISIYYLAKSDISKLCVEQSKRQLLDTDFLTMTEVKPTIDYLSKYIYGTVGYTKGSKEITGWSDMFEITTGWYESGYTYIENISRLLKYSQEFDFDASLVEKKFFDSKEVLIPDCYVLDVEDSVIIDSSDAVGIKTFASCWFEIEYQPLNDFTIVHEKDEIELKLSQLDGSQSAITNLDSYNKAEKDKIDRIGQEIFSISQRVNNNEFNKIQKVPSVLDDEYIVFKRTVSIGLNCSNVNYSASKSAIIKNYFTSIATKYRAYAYTDYNSAIVRKENTTVYALLSKDYKYNGDEHLIFGNLPLGIKKYSKDFLSQFDSTNTNKLYYGFEYDEYLSQQPNVYTNGAFKNELSITTFGTNVALNFEEFDNVSAGLKIINTDDYYEYSEGKYKTKLGGLPQWWYKWKNPEPDSRLIGFVSTVEPKLEELPDLEDVFDYKQKVFETPLISQYANVPFADVDSQIILYDIPGMHEKIFYKDQSEIINQTLQITYYSDDENVIFGDSFTDTICWKGKNAQVKLLKLVEGHTITEMPKFNNEKHVYSADFESAYTASCCQIVTSGDNVGVRVDYDKAIHCNGRYYLRFIYPEQLPYWKDICEFSISDEQFEFIFDGTHHYLVYWLTLNDTKTNKVYDITGQDIPTLEFEVSNLTEGQDSGRDVTRRSGPKRFVLKGAESVRLATDPHQDHDTEHITLLPENFEVNKWYGLKDELYEVGQSTVFEYAQGKEKFLVIRRKNGENYFRYRENDKPETEQIKVRRIIYNDEEKTWTIDGLIYVGRSYSPMKTQIIPAKDVDLFIYLTSMPNINDFADAGWAEAERDVLCMSVYKYGDMDYI